MKLKSQKGSITLFILVSLLLFIAMVVSVYTFMKGKSSSINNELKQIKSKYEISDNDLTNLYNSTINFMPTINLTRNQNKVNGRITLNTSNLNIKVLKYGWVKSDRELAKNELSTENIMDWTFLENQEGNFNINIIKEDVQVGYYYICLMVNNMEFWKGIEIEPLMSTDGRFTPEDSNWNVTNIQDALDNLYQFYSN